MLFFDPLAKAGETGLVDLGGSGALRQRPALNMFSRVRECVIDNHWTGKVASAPWRDYLSLLVESQGADKQVRCCTWVCQEVDDRCIVILHLFRGRIGYLTFGFGRLPIRVKPAE